MISIVIPAYNEADQLPATLESVRRAFQSLPSPEAYEIVVCDNNSTDETRAVAETRGARVIFEPHNQISRARNSGARAATGQWLVFLDADTRLPQPLLREMVEGTTTGRFHGGGAPVRFDTFRLRPAPALAVALWNTVSRCSKLAAGSFIFCLRKDWETIGGFDESVYAGEELHFSAKLKKELARQERNFAILSTPVPTSARKLEWNSDWQLLKLIPLALRPGALQNREACAFWYQRPVKHQMESKPSN